MSNIYVVLTIARMVNGEYVFVKSERAFKDKEKAEAFHAETKKQFMEPDGKIKIVKLSTGNGEAACFCEVGIFEIELED